VQIDSQNFISFGGKPQAVDQTLEVVHDMQP
jgi:hypothetical protein